MVAAVATRVFRAQESASGMGKHAAAEEVAEGSNEKDAAMMSAGTQLG